MWKNKENGDSAVKDNDDDNESLKIFKKSIRHDKNMDLRIRKKGRVYAKNLKIENKKYLLWLGI